MHGTVLKKDGTPLAGARVIARSAETGRSAQATTDASGKFELKAGDDGAGLAPGEYDVIVLEDRGDPDARRPSMIAAKYRNHETSGLKVVVVPGESTDLDLTLDPK